MLIFKYQFALKDSFPIREVCTVNLNSISNIPLIEDSNIEIIVRDSHCFRHGHDR
jgi:hypothetical protein